MNFVSVDVEADGPIPGKYSMISLAAVVVEKPFDDYFTCNIKAVTDNYVEDALKVTGISREETLSFPSPEVQIARFNEWLKDLKIRKGYPIFIADNNGFDWQFINYYLHYYEGENPFGYSSWNLNSFYKGLEKDFKAKFKRYRITKHTHDPLDDATGNAEALNTILELYNLNDTK